MIVAAFCDEPRDVVGAAPPDAATAPPREYLGTKKCRMCHVDQHRSWKESAKGSSWDALKPGLGVKVKSQAGLDPDTDYTADARCLDCHAVGFGKPGGYVIPTPGDAASKRYASSREGVGCEACHGPGSDFVKIMQDIYRSDRTYHPDELRAAGLRVVTRTVCLGCHSKRAPCMTAGDSKSWLNVDVTDRDGFHAKFPLPHRATPGRDSSETEGPSPPAPAPGSRDAE